MNEHLSENQKLLRYALLLNMPLHYNGLVMENTNRCNARCAICYQSAGGQENNTRLDLETAKTCIREAAEIDCIEPRFHLAGGEAFLYPEDCFALFQTAKEAGYTMITATTNGFWGKDLQKARQTCQRLRECGLTSMELSWDHWHSEFIPAAAMDNCLLACREYGIGTNLRLLTTKSHDMEEALSRLSPEALRAADKITSAPVFATGRAAQILPREDFYHSRVGLDDNCHSTLNLTVNSFGEVFPCCAGMDTCRDCAGGNIYQQPISHIVESMNADPLLRQLVFLGVKSFLPLLRANGCEIDEEKYFSICQLCSSIFSNPEYLAIIQNEFNKKRQSALEKAVARLEAKFLGQEKQNDA